MNEQSQGNLKKQLLKLDQMGNQLIGIIKLKFVSLKLVLPLP